MAPALDAYITEWERVQRHRRPDAHVRSREDGLRHFLSLGFPTTRDEEWRFTSVAPIAEGTFALSMPQHEGVRSIDLDRFRIPGPTAAELVFVNGHYVPALSRTDGLPSGTRADSLAAATEQGVHEVTQYLARVATPERHAFVALSTAFLDDGACIQLPAGVVVEHPIHLVFLSVDEPQDVQTMAHPRVLIVLGANSQAAVIETYAGPAGRRYFTNAVTEVVLLDGAVMNHYKLQHEGQDAYHVGSVHVRAHRGASCTAHSVSVGGALVRNDVAAVLDGEGVHCALNGLYLADGHRLVDNHTTIDHARPHSESREIYAGILAEHARGVFNGKVIVRPDAQKTDAKQTNRALLLSEDAQINTKPQLEIFANDVKCTHGAAVGQLDDEALFYMRSRGLSEGTARHLLVRAFAADVLNRLPHEAVRARVEAHLQEQLARMLPAAA